MPSGYIQGKNKNMIHFMYVKKLKFLVPLSILLKIFYFNTYYMRSLRNELQKAEYASILQRTLIHCHDVASFHYRLVLNVTT